MSMPSKFGKPEKVYVKRDPVNNNAVDIYLLSLDEDGHLQAPTPTLMSNVQEYLIPYRIMTAGVNIIPADIINLSVEFGVVITPKLNRTEVMAKCLDVVRDYFSTNTAQIGSPIVISDLHAAIQEVYGVISVYELKLYNVIGQQTYGSYSTTTIDIDSKTQNNILYCPETAIFEIKFPTKDIIGKSK